MDKKIYLPNDEQIGKLIVGGYCAGYNDSLLIVRGQLQAIDLINDTFKPAK